MSEVKKVAAKEETKVENVKGIGDIVGVSAFSLKSIGARKDVKEVKDEVKEEVKVNREYFSEEDFNRVWGELVFVAEKEVSSYFASCLNEQPHVEGEEVKISVVSRKNRTTVMENRDFILNFLKERLKNDYLTIKVEVMDSDLVEKVVTDKYALLVRKNPMIEELRSAFDLDVDI